MTSIHDRHAVGLDSVEYADRAHTAEQELSAVYAALRDLREWLSYPGRGNVIFRSEVAGRLERILDS